MMGVEMKVLAFGGAGERAGGGYRSSLGIGEMKSWSSGGGEGGDGAWGE